MFKKYFVIITSFLITSATLKPAPVFALPANISFSCGYETEINGNGCWQAKYVTNEDRIKRVTDTYRKGVASIRIEVDPGDVIKTGGSTWSGERSELHILTNPDGSQILEDENSGTQYYALSVKLASDWKQPYIEGSSAYWSMFLQLHSNAALNASPAFSLNAMDQFYVVIIGGNLDDTNHYYKYSLLSKADLNRGHWVDFVIGIKYAKDNTGAVNIWRRDEGESTFTNVFSVNNIPTLQYKTSVSSGAIIGHYWQTGLYRPNNIPHSNVLWLDGMTRGTTFDAVVAEAFPTTTGGTIPSITPVITPTKTPTPTNSNPTPTSILPTTIPTPTCSMKNKGDSNCNDVITDFDYSCWSAAYQENPAPTPGSGEYLLKTCQSSDFNGDTKTDLIDFEIWRQTIYGK